MNQHMIRPALAVAALLAAGSAAAQSTIKDYLFAHNAGPVAANDIIGVSKSVVSDLQTPRDFAMSVGNFGDRDTQGGFGLSFTPGRSGFEAVAVAADKYAQGDVLRRIWGGTTFSYAQNRQEIGSGKYDQSALALSATWLLHNEEDPIVVAYRTLAQSEGESEGRTKPPACRQDGLNAAAAADDADKESRRLVAAFEQEKGRSPDATEMVEIVKQVNAASRELEALAVLRSCAHQVAADVAKKWNASRVQLLVGRGWIKPAAGGGERLRLATHAKISLALGQGDDGLFNATWRRAADELDLTTLGGTPSFKNTNSAALRYTYRASKRGDMFAIAEVSNVKATTTTISQADFKQALGLDKMVMPGLWLEFRYGRARSATGTTLENKALLTLKFSQDTSLDKQAN